MSEEPVRDAFVDAISNQKRNGVALGALLLSIGVAVMIGTATAYYTVALIAFCIWMAWFVHTGVEFLQHLDL